MELRKLDTNLFKALYLITAGIVVTQVLDLDSLTSMLFMLTFPITVLLWLRSVRKTLTGTDILMLAAAILASVNVLLDISISNADVSFDYIKKLIMFIMSLLFLQTANRVHVGNEFVSFINRLVDFLTVFLIIMYFLDYTQMHLLNGYVTVYLTFRFTNPNLTALFMTCLYMLEVYRLFTPERWYWKLLHVLMAVFLAVFVWQTQSRNCLLVLVLFTAASAWLIFRGRRNLKIGKLWAALIAAFPVLFMAAYMLVVNTAWAQKLFAFLVGEGKKLNSRVKIWTPALETLRESPLIGSYCGVSDGTGISQLHNSHLDIAASYGILVLVLVLILLTRYLHQNGKVYRNKSSYLYMLSFACTILLGMGEAALFSGGLAIYVFIGSFLLLANRELPWKEL